jgi:hypothetical protein
MKGGVTTVEEIPRPIRGVRRGVHRGAKRLVAG